MKHILTSLFCFLLFGANVLAQNNTFPEGTIIVNDRSVAAYPMILKSNTLLGPFDKDDEGVNYFRDDKHYRKLFPHEIKQFDAISKIKIENGKLYFDGKRIKTGRVRIRDVESAYYWDGGVVVLAYVKKPWTLLFFGYSIGFIDLQKSKCKFSAPNWKAARGDINILPSFIVPTTMNVLEARQRHEAIKSHYPPNIKLTHDEQMSAFYKSYFPPNTDLTFDVQVPEEISLDETLNCVLTLTNNTNRPIPVPESLLDGLVLRRWYDQNPFNIRKYRRYTYSETTNKGHILQPDETKETVVAFQVRDMFHFLKDPIPLVRYIISFHWCGAVNPDDPREFSWFTAVKKVQVTDNNPYQIDTTSTDLELNVSIPKRIGEWEKPNCTISLTNKSDKPILVPDSLFEGLGISYEYVRLPRARKAKSGIHTRKHPLFPEALLSKSTPLMPSETRESTVMLGADIVAKLAVYFDHQGAYIDFIYPMHLVFHFNWDGLLDPNDNKKITRFTCDVPVEVYWTDG
jgi:hypothetical protein